MIEKRLVSLLLADTTVATLVGTKIFPVAIRKAVGWPALVYARMAGQPDYTLAGRGEWRTAQIEMVAWAQEYAEARAIAEAVRDLLDAYADDLSEGAIRFISVADGADDYVQELDVFGAVLALTVEYDDEWEEPAP